MKVSSATDAGSEVERLTNFVLDEGDVAGRQLAIYRLGELVGVGEQALSVAATRGLARIGLEFERGRLPAELEFDFFEVALDVLQANEEQTRPISGNGDTSEVGAASRSLGKLTEIVRRKFSNGPSRAAMLELARFGGDIERGEVVFRTHTQAQCVRCHRLGQEGSNVGPDLAGIASKRDAEYLYRAVVDPSADIDEKYRTQMVLLDSDEVVQGVQIAETDEILKLANSQGEIVEVSKEEIVEVSENKVSLMPEIKEVLTPREVRDLVAYLSTLKAEAE
jgi:putative heme-binding domain-containing protein